MTSEVEELIGLYRSMRTARCIDTIENDLISRGEAYFSVSGAGHEASAGLASFLIADDYLHCHYRDKALLHARGLPVKEFFDSLVCNANSHSAGRQMSAHLSSRELNILSIVGPVGNSALQAAGIAQVLKQANSAGIVICSFGDGTSQQGEVLEAIAEAVRSTLPVFFLIHDNHFSISTETGGKTFFSHPLGPACTYYGLPIHQVDGRQALACRERFRTLISDMRKHRGPTICVMQVDRLSSHTNADDDSVYRDPAAVQLIRETRDPLSHFRSTIAELDGLREQLDQIDKHIWQEVRAAAEASLEAPPPEPAETKTINGVGWRALPNAKTVTRGPTSAPIRTMAESIRDSLKVRMTVDERVTLYGQDIEDPKGDVFGVTRGLTRSFPGRVNNSPLSESTIVGTSIGKALAGARPVALLQFADFIPLAFNQLATELATMEWRTQGRWSSPVIVMAPCGGYRPGLGPFHAHTYDSTLAHIPGLDVAMPSTAADAAGILNAAFEGGRPTILLYPKAILNDPGRGTAWEVGDCFAPVGTARIVRKGTDLTLIGWGNTTSLCEHAAEQFALLGYAIEVVDLRWLAPWDREMVCNSVQRTRRLVVVHEDNLSAGFGGEIVASVAETIVGPFQTRRVARPDTHIPCHFGNQSAMLPSIRSVLEAVAALLDVDVSWESAIPLTAGKQIIYIIGSSPADQTVTIADMCVRAGDQVKVGQVLASVEADKANIDIASPASGVVEAIFCDVGDRRAVNSPLLVLGGSAARSSAAVNANNLTPILKHKTGKRRGTAVPANCPTVIMTGLSSTLGRLELRNSDLAFRFPSWSADPTEDGILRRTGIESRRVADDDQDVTSMAVEAAHGALREARIDATELSLILCSTSTPSMISPSTACQVLRQLAPDSVIAAYDIQAACSGYLYALCAAWDFLQTHASAYVLVLTSEIMRRVVDIDDPNTSPLFGDAATASVLTTTANRASGLATICRPVIGAFGEDGATLQVPLPNDGHFVKMDGQQIFSEAVRRMRVALFEACTASGITVDELDLIVPHQANGRIIEAMRARMGITEDRMWNGIRYHGNTSSSSIPLALDTVLRQKKKPRNIGLCTFGAGYTFGGAILLPSPVEMNSSMDCTQSSQVN